MRIDAAAGARRRWSALGAWLFLGVFAVPSWAEDTRQSLSAGAAARATIVALQKECSDFAQRTVGSTPVRASAMKCSRGCGNALSVVHKMETRGKGDFGGPVDLCRQAHGLWQDALKEAPDVTPAPPKVRGNRPQR